MRVFYCVPPRRKAIGKGFAALQFSPPVPELLAAVLQQMKSLPSNEVHAFWVTPVDAFDELTPAKVLAGGFRGACGATAMLRGHLSQSASERHGRVIAQLAALACAARIDVTQPGTFHIPANVAEKGLIAVFTLQADILLARPQRHHVEYRRRGPWRSCVVPVVRRRFTLGRGQGRG